MDRLKAKHIVIGVVGLVALFFVISLALANSVGSGSDMPEDDEPPREAVPEEPFSATEAPSPAS